ncbi:hypothetical protein KI688_002315 [Linnemannia hyalina]|uniref:UBC core domain-containing protein n=1 Tax=Linnemannia hyalina TaxID=64524 RepID=A0A9P7XSN3_9FUNG|nr:hypothetical protein KI688_002315 [Linnemannia hyalina]
MSSAVHRRMLKEYMAIQKNAATRPHLELLEPIQEDNLLHWQAILLGTADSAYEGGRFKLDIVIPTNYPIQSPTIRFVTKICHPNVHFKTGEICLDILKSEWTPAWTLESVCVAISSLLTNPEPSSPLNCDAVIAIGPHLNPPEFSSCVRVCRQWNKTFVPFLWETVDDTLFSWRHILKQHDADDSKGDKDEGWLRSIFVKHGHLIRHLSLSWKVSILAAGLSGQCTNLLSLSLTTSALNKTTREAEALATAKRFKLEDGGRTEGERAKKGVTGPVLVPEFEGLFVLRAAMWRSVAEQEQDWTTNQHLWQLVRSNSSLRTLRLSLSEAELCKMATIDVVYDILSSLKDITRLESTTYAILLDRLLDRVPTIQHVQMDSARVGDGFATRTFLGLQTLVIKTFVSSKLFLELLHSLPNLEHFRLIAVDNYREYFRDAALYLDSTPSRLKGLHFNIGKSFDFGKMANYILPWLPDLTEMTLGWLDSVTARALTTYCRSFQIFREPGGAQSTFSLDDNREVSSHLEVLLQECPQLRIVDAICHRVDADRMLALPWICHRLEVLYFQIVGVCRLKAGEQKNLPSIISANDDETDRKLTNKEDILDRYRRGQDQQNKIFTQLALMTHLKVLDLGLEWRNLGHAYWVEQYEVEGQKYVRYTSPYADTLELTLQSGLDQLTGLVNLEVFGFEGINHRLGDQELAWIAVHWVRLRVMRGLQEDSLPMLEPDARRTKLRRRMQELCPNVRHRSLRQVPESYS